MPSTYSNNLRLELIASGEQGNTWGNTTNVNFGTLVENAISGYKSLSNMTNANYTLTALNGADDEARRHFLVVPSSVTLTAQRAIIAPSVPKGYVITNNSTGGFAIQIKTAGSSGTTLIPNGTTKYVVCDGTEFYETNTAVTQLTLANAPAVNSHAATKLYVDTADNLKLNLSGGTMSGALTLNGATPTGAQATSKDYVFTNFIWKTAGGAAQEIYTNLHLNYTPSTGPDAINLTYLNTQLATKANNTVTLTSTNAALTFNGASSAQLNGNITVDFASGAGVTSVTASAPVTSSGGSNPNIAMGVASSSTNGYLSATDWNTFNGKVGSSALSSYATTSYVNSTFVTYSTVTSNYLPLTGGTMSGAIQVVTNSTENAYMGVYAASVVFGSIKNNNSLYAPMYLGQINNTGSRVLMGFDTNGAAAIIGALDIQSAAWGSGTLRAAGQVTFTNLATGSVSSSGGLLTSSSDQRLKTPFADMNNGLALVRKLRARYFHWNDKDEGDKPAHYKEKQLGFFAQEVNTICPEAAPAPNEELGDKWGIYDRGLIAMLVSAVQELDLEVERLRSVMGFE